MVWVLFLYIPLYSWIKSSFPISFTTYSKIYHKNNIYIKISFLLRNAKERNHWYDRSETNENLDSYCLPVLSLSVEERNLRCISGVTYFGSFLHKLFIIWVNTEPTLVLSHNYCFKYYYKWYVYDLPLLYSMCKSFTCLLNDKNFETMKIQHKKLH